MAKSNSTRTCKWTEMKKTLKEAGKTSHVDTPLCSINSTASYLLKAWRKEGQRGWERQMYCFYAEKHKSDLIKHLHNYTLCPAKLFLPFCTSTARDVTRGNRAKSAPRTKSRPLDGLWFKGNWSWIWAVLQCPTPTTSLPLLSYIHFIQSITHDDKSPQREWLMWSWEAGALRHCESDSPVDIHSP